MRNLVVCCDGTWNTPDQEHDGVPTPTNVVRLHNALAEVDTQENVQLRYYHPGVGTDGTWWDKIAGGGFGIGLDENIMSAYHWLGSHYRQSDRIYLFGFSRGAYTVRSLAGMISRSGLLALDGLNDKEAWKRVKRAYNCYRRKKHDPTWMDEGWAFHDGGEADGGVPIHFIGVWDTVGALGIPNDMAISNLLDDISKESFHDTNLGTSTHNARHAIGLDESRASFTPTLWTNVEGREGVKQVWFPGVHCDVGGGYPETGLSDGALLWMMEEAEGCGLAFHSGMKGQIRPDSHGVLHDSRRGVFRYLRTQPRSVPILDEPSGSPDLHPSVQLRRRNPPITQAPYRRTRRLEVGDKVTVSVYARDPWNGTGIYMALGSRFRFTATGEWLDRRIAAGPDGKTNGGFKIDEIARAAGSMFGRLEELYKMATGNEQADFRGTKREEGFRWFALVGAVANGGSPHPDGTPVPHETFLIGEGCEYPASGVIENPGYLYCFANDAWHFYDNNRGKVSLTIQRLI